MGRTEEKEFGPCFHTRLHGVLEDPSKEAFQTNGFLVVLIYYTSRLCVLSHAAASLHTMEPSFLFSLSPLPTPPLTHLPFSLFSYLTTAKIARQRGHRS